jgi:uncharacterized membrane protein HdeD (DUF308 family)
MSGAVMQPGFGGPDAARVSHKWGWFVALGAVMVLGGIFALGDTVLVTIISVLFIGAALLVGGVFQIIHAFMTKGWSAFAFSLLCGILYVISGLLIMQEPVSGSLVITIFLSVALVVGGVFRIVIGLRHREMAGWWLIVLGGAIGVIAGIILYSSLPWSSLWLLGTIIGIELIFQGVAWMALGFSLRKLKAA